MGWACPARALALCLGWACGASSPTVQSYPQPDFARAEPVSVEPPPAQIEHLDDEPPASGCLWADGQWVWTMQRWDWHPGSWVRPPDGCRYSSPSVQWAPSGQTGVLYYRPGRWYSVSEPRPCPEPVSCPSQSPAHPHAPARSGS